MGREGRGRGWEGRREGGEERGGEGEDVPDPLLFSDNSHTALNVVRTAHSNSSDVGLVC